MDSYDVRRLALVLAVQAEIEGMRVENIMSKYYTRTIVYDEKKFKEKAEQLRNLAASHNEQL